jgi:hypothetical protein
VRLHLSHGNNWRFLGKGEFAYIFGSCALNASAVHCAFDLLELDGKDLRCEPIGRPPTVCRDTLLPQSASIDRVARTDSRV